MPTNFILQGVEGRKNVSAIDQFGNEWSSFDFSQSPEYLQKEMADKCCECGKPVVTGFVCMETVEVACQSHFSIASFKKGPHGTGKEG